MKLEFGKFFTSGGALEQSKNAKIVVEVKTFLVSNPGY